MDEVNSSAGHIKRGEILEMASAPTISVRYWAGARAAAGVERESLNATSVGNLRSVAIALHPALSDVLPRCSVLVDGVRADDDQELRSGATVEVLPPFAGG